MAEECGDGGILPSKAIIMAEEWGDRGILPSNTTIRLAKTAMARWDGIILPSNTTIRLAETEMARWDGIILPSKSTKCIELLQYYPVRPITLHTQRQIFSTG
jgi:hypothetical protein